MAKPDRRITFRPTDAEAAVVENILRAQPHLTKSDVVHAMFEDKREVVAAALRAAPVATRPAVRLDRAALATLDGAADGLDAVGRELRPIRSLANQMARASNSGDPLVAAQLARIADALEAAADSTAAIATKVNAVTTWHS